MTIAHKRQTLRTKSGGFALILALLLILVVSLWGANRLLFTRSNIESSKNNLRLASGLQAAAGGAEVAKVEIETLFRKDGLEYGTAQGGAADLDYNLLKSNETIGFVFSRNRNSGNWQQCPAGTLNKNCLYKKAKRGNVQYSIVIVPAGAPYTGVADTLFVEYYAAILTSPREMGTPAFNPTSADFKTFNLPEAGQLTLPPSNSTMVNYLAANGGKIDTRRFGYTATYYALPGGVYQGYLGRIVVSFNAKKLDNWLFIPNEADQSLTVVNTRFWKAYQKIPLKYPNPCRVWVDPYWNRLVLVSHCPDRYPVGHALAGQIPADNPPYAKGDGKLAPLHTSILLLNWDPNAAVNKDDDFTNDLQPAASTVYLDDSVALLKSAVKNVSLQDVTFAKDSLLMAGVDKYGKTVFLNLAGGGIAYSTGTNLCPGVPSTCEGADRTYSYADGSGGLWNRIYVKPNGTAFVNLVNAQKLVKFNTKTNAVSWTIDPGQSLSPASGLAQYFEMAPFAHNSNATYGLAINNLVYTSRDLGAFSDPTSGQRSGQPFGAYLQKIDESSGTLTDTSTDSNSLPFWWLDNSGGSSASRFSAITNSYIDPTTLALGEKAELILPHMSLNWTLNVEGRSSSSSNSSNPLIPDSFPASGNNDNSARQLLVLNSFSNLLQERYDNGFYTGENFDPNQAYFQPISAKLDWFKTSLANSMNEIELVGSIPSLPIIASMPATSDNEDYCYSEDLSRVITGRCPAADLKGWKDIQVKAFSGMAPSLSRDANCLNDRCAVSMQALGMSLVFDLRTQYANKVTFPGCESTVTRKSGGMLIADSPCSMTENTPNYTLVGPNTFDCISITGNGAKLWYYPCMGAIDATARPPVVLTTTTPTYFSDPFVSNPVYATFADKPGTTRPGYVDAFGGTTVKIKYP